MGIFGLWDMIIIVVALGIMSGVVHDYLKTKRKTASSSNLSPEYITELEDQAAKVPELEERIQALEKIVTDSRSQLREDIDRL